MDAILARLIPLTDHLFGKGSYVTSTFANEQRCRQLVSNVLKNLKDGTEVTDLAALQQSSGPRPARRPSTVSLLITYERIPDGIRLEYRPSLTEEKAIGHWLKEDPRRGYATWVNDRAKPLLWEADGERYSPSGLVTHIWRLAEWKEAWVAVQGPKQWAIPGEGTLLEIGEILWQRILTEESPPDGDREPG